jgi:hypothetical protein
MQAGAAIMEIIGLLIGCLIFIGVGGILGIVFAFIRALRNFVLAVAIVPTISFFLLITLGWLTLDNAPICGPDPEWDRCPSHIAHIVMWFAWGTATILAVFATIFLQKFLVISWQNFKHRNQPLNIIERSKET